MGLNGQQEIFCKVGDQMSYYIGLDDNGKAYIEHARKLHEPVPGHKYKERWWNAEKGRYDYVYTIPGTKGRWSVLAPSQIVADVKEGLKKATPYLTGEKSLGFKERRAWKQAGKEWERQRSEGKLGWGAELKTIKTNYDYFRTPLGKLEDKIQRALSTKMKEVDAWFKKTKAKWELKRAQRIVKREARKTMKEVDEGISGIFSDIYSFFSS